MLNLQIWFKNNLTKSSKCINKTSLYMSERTGNTYETLKRSGAFGTQFFSFTLFFMAAKWKCVTIFSLGSWISFSSKVFVCLDSQTAEEPPFNSKQSLKIKMSLMSRKPLLLQLEGILVLLKIRFSLDANLQTTTSQIGPILGPPKGVASFSWHGL